MGRMAIGGHDQHRRGLNQHRLARVGIQDVGKKLFGGVNVGPIQQFLIRYVDPRSVGRRARAGAAVSVVACALPLVVVCCADQQVDEPFFLIQAEHFADFRRPLKNEMGAIEKDRLLGHWHDESPFCGLRRIDVILAETQVGVRHAGSDLGGFVAHAPDAQNPLAVEPGGNRADELRDHKRLLLVCLQDLRPDHLPGDIREGRHVHGLAGFQQCRAPVARIHLPHSFAAQRGLSKFPNAEILGL